MADRALKEGLARLESRDGDFYNRECGWSGNELAYANESGKGKTLANPPTSSPNHRLYKPFQGHCPKCGIPFRGCFNK